jgi:hypothetical protein
MLNEGIAHDPATMAQSRSRADPSGATGQSRSAYAAALSAYSKTLAQSGGRSKKELIASHAQPRPERGSMSIAFFAHAALSCDRELLSSAFRTGRFG